MDRAELEKRNFSVWLCSRQTEEECLNRNLFGDSVRSPRAQAEPVREGDVLFLLNITTRELIGIFIAASEPGHNLEPDAWQGNFPYQIRVKPVGKIVRIENAPKCFMQVGIELIHTKIHILPRFFVYGPEYTKKILALFPDEAFSERGHQIKTRETVISTEHRKITFNDVAGLTTVKQFIRERMIEPMLYPKLACRYRLRLGGGLLLFGPPGTGKTLIARATAGELEAEFIEISPSVIRGFPGEPEKRLEEIFKNAMKKPRVVVFLDEAEALLSNREGQSSSVMQRITPVFLSLFSKVAEQNAPVLIIAATNEPLEIDPAFLRPGRLDLRLMIGLPDKETLQEIIRLQLRDRPHELNDENIKELAEGLEGWSGADVKELFDKVVLECYRESPKPEPDEEDEEIDDSKIVKISMEKIIEIRPTIKPSVGKELLEKLETWNSKFGSLR